jgi:hypothetical protein
MLELRISFSCWLDLGQGKGLGIGFGLGLGSGIRFRNEIRSGLALNLGLSLRLAWFKGNCYGKISSDQYRIINISRNSMAQL